MTGGGLTSAAHSAYSALTRLPAHTPGAGSRAGAPGGENEPPVTVPRVPAREAAERELSEPKYREHDPSLLQRAANWLFEHVGSLLASAADATPGGWAGLAALAVLVVLLLVALRLRLGRLRPATGPHDGARPVLAGLPRTADEHRAAAETHAAAECWAEAVQERMRAIVRALEERALLDPRAGRTADEAAHEAGRLLPEHASRLRSAALAFDEVTYAGHPADPTAYHRLRDLDTALRRTRPRLDTHPAATAPAATAPAATDTTDADVPDFPAQQPDTTPPGGGR